MLRRLLDYLKKLPGLTLELQMAQSRSYLHTFGPKVGITSGFQSLPAELAGFPQFRARSRLAFYDLPSRKALEQRSCDSIAGHQNKTYVLGKLGR